jgi:hypothetical protein
MVKISIIVPVYKTEAYLEKCLNSLVNQTFQDIEIIVVNDGSPDNSQNIIDIFAAKYPDRIRAHQKTNGGLSSARNYGISKAKGQFLGFVDSDDWVDPKTFELLYAKAIEEDYDLTVCDVLFVYPDHDDRVDSGIPYDLKTKQQVKKSLTNIFPAAWNKLYKRSLFDHGFQFKEGIWFEDVEFLFKAVAHVNSIGSVHQPLIHYFQRENAITKTYNVRLNDYLSNWDSIIQYYKVQNLYDDYKKELEYNDVRYILGTYLKNASKASSVEFFEEAIELAFCHIEKHFKHYRRNPYFYSNGLKGLYLLVVNRALARYLRKITFKA